MLALKRLPEKHTLIKLAAQTNRITQILIQTGRAKSSGRLPPGIWLSYLRADCLYTGIFSAPTSGLAVTRGGGCTAP